MCSWSPQLGMRQHYYLGQLFQQRYSTELNASYLFDNYTRTQIYVRSTDVDRTLMSAQCQLASLFEPASEQVGEEKGMKRGGGGRWGEGMEGEDGGGEGEDGGGWRERMEGDEGRRCRGMEGQWVEQTMWLGGRRRKEW